MKARTFANEMKPYHHEWASQVLCMEINPEIGPDLIDDNKFIELKFTLAGPFKPTKNGKPQHYPLAWTVLENQMQYPALTGKEGYWGLAIYKLSKPVRSIDAIDIMRGLERLVVRREIYMVRFDWMDQYTPSRTRGKTYFSEWDNTFRYPKFKDLPKVTDTEDVFKGRVHITEGVSKAEFKFVPF